MSFDLGELLKEAQSRGLRMIIGVFHDGFSLSIVNTKTDENECHFFQYMYDLNMYLHDWFKIVKPVQ